MQVIASRLTLNNWVIMIRFLRVKKMILKNNLDRVTVRIKFKNQMVQFYTKMINSNKIMVCTKSSPW